MTMRAYFTRYRRGFKVHFQSGHQFKTIPCRTEQDAKKLVADKNRAIEAQEQREKNND